LVNARAAIGGVVVVSGTDGVGRGKGGVELSACASGDEVFSHGDAGADDLWREQGFTLLHGNAGTDDLWRGRGGHARVRVHVLWWWVIWWTWTWVRVGGRVRLGGLGLVGLAA
jgi:hypothetical protein